MTIQIQKLTEPVMLAEGPHWDSDQQLLYFVDILGQLINKYDPLTGNHSKTKLDERVSLIVPVEGTRDQFVIGLEHKFLVVRWDGMESSSVEVLRELGEVEAGLPTRTNDGKVDPKGRLFAGTTCDAFTADFLNKAAFYRLQKDNDKLTKLVDGISVSNGLAWDFKDKALYLIDSLEYKIRRYDYDIETGDIKNMKYVFDFKTNNIEGIADGCTIDTDGNLWVAMWEGSCVLKIDPRTGKVVQKVAMPVRQVTSATFGGPHLDILFVTTGNHDLPAEEIPQSGSVFKITGLGVKGNTNYNFKL